MTNRDSGKEIQLNAKDKLKWSQQKFDINSTVDTVFSAQKYTIPEKKEITLLVQKLVNQKFDVSKLADFLRKVEKKKNPLKALEKFVNEFLKQVVEKEDIQAKQPKITVKMKKERESQIRGIEATTQQNNKEATAKQKEVTDKQKEIEKIKEYNKTLKRLRDSYKNLPPQFKTHTPEEVQSKLSSLTPETRQAVQSSGMKLEEYVSMLLKPRNLNMLLKALIKNVVSLSILLTGFQNLRLQKPLSLKRIPISKSMQEIQKIKHLKILNIQNYFPIESGLLIAN